MSTNITGGHAESVTTTSQGNVNKSDGWFHRKRVLRRTHNWPIGGLRKFNINPISQEDISRFPVNIIRNNRYRWYSAPIVALWNQLFRMPYTLLLLLTVLESLKLTYDVSSRVSSLYMRSLPAVVALVVSATLDLLEDWRSYRTACVLNSRVFVVVDGRRPNFHSVPSQDLRVGQIVRLHKDQEFPADCLLLCTSNPDGRAFVSQELVTGNENLVKKIAIKETRFEISAQTIANISGSVLCNQATVDLNNFYGTLRLEAHPRGANLDNKSFICQGSILRRTEWIYCLVLFTGPDTKMARARSQIAPLTKHQKVPFETYIDRMAFVLVAAIIFFSFISATLGWRISTKCPFKNINSDSDVYLIFCPDHGFSWWTLFLQHMAVYCVCVSPNVLCFLDILGAVKALDITRRMSRMKKVVTKSSTRRSELLGELTRRTTTIRSRLTQLESTGDVALSTPETSESVKINRSDVLKNLGCVDYILTDKTGTLTKACPLKFLYCSVGRRIYGKCFRHKNQKFYPTAPSGVAFTPNPPKVKVKQRDDLKPSLKKRVNTLQDSGTEAAPVTHSSCVTGDQDVVPQTELSAPGKKIFRFDMEFEACPTPLIDLLSDAETLLSGCSETTFDTDDECSEHGLARDVFSKVNRSNYYVPLKEEESKRFDPVEDSLEVEMSQIRNLEWETEVEDNESTPGKAKKRRRRLHVSFQSATHEDKSDSSESSKPAMFKSYEDVDLSSELNVSGNTPRGTPQFQVEQFHQAVLHASFSSESSSIGTKPMPASLEPEPKALPAWSKINHSLARRRLSSTSQNIPGSQSFSNQSPVSLPQGSGPKRIFELKEQLKRQGLAYAGNGGYHKALLTNSRLLAKPIKRKGSGQSNFTGLESSATIGDTSEKLTQFERDIESKADCSDQHSEGSHRKQSTFQHSVSHASAKTEDELEMLQKHPRRSQSGEVRLESMPRSKAKKRASTFREGTIEGAHCIDFEDIQILKDLRKGGVRGALIDDFLKGMLFCNSVLTDMDLSHYPLCTPKVSSDGDSQHSETWSDETSSEGDTSRSSTGPPHVVAVEKLPIPLLAQRALLESVELSSPFPDELPMVYTAYKLGYGLFNRTKRWIVIEINGQFIRYEKLFSMEYCDDRKRTLVVVRQEGRPTATVYCKGGASCIFELLDRRSEDPEGLRQRGFGTMDSTSGYCPHGRGGRLTREKKHKDFKAELKSITAKHAHKFVMRGFRTLAIAKRKLSALDVEVLLRRVDGFASCSLIQKDHLSKTLASELESGLEILGVVGLLETLHPGIQKTVSCITQAGVKIWMLTGDDHERAIGAACQAQILRSNMKLLRIELSCAKSMREVALIHESFKLELERKKPNTEIACFITGNDLQNFLVSTELETVLLSMLCRCEVVLVCEVSATQKADVTRLLRTRLTPTPIIMAVGDGLNDVPMFKEAHVSVAVGGRKKENARLPPNPLQGDVLSTEKAESKQNALYDGIYDGRLEADIILQSFTDLRTLMFEHGRASLKSAALWVRTSWVLAWAHLVPLIVFSFHNMSSAVPLWSRLGMYLIEALCIGGLAIVALLCDTEFSHVMLWHLPVLYIVSRRKGLMNRAIIWIDTLYAVIMSICAALTVHEVVGAAGGQIQDAFTRDSLHALTFLTVCCITVIGGSFLTLQSTAHGSPLFYIVALLLFGCAFVALSTPSDMSWLYTLYARSDTGWIEAADAAGIVLIVIAVFTGSVVTIQALTAIKLAIYPDLTKVVRLLIHHHKNKFLEDRRAMRGAGLAAGLSTASLRGKEAFTLTRLSTLKKNYSGFPTAATSYAPMTTRPPPGWYKESDHDTLAFATFVKTVLNPVKVKRVAAMLPFPRRFTLLQPTRMGTSTFPLPFTSPVDKATEACLFRKGEGPEEGLLHRDQREDVSDEILGGKRLNRLRAFQDPKRHYSQRSIEQFEEQDHVGDGMEFGSEHSFSSSDAAKPQAEAAKGVAAQGNNDGNVVKAFEPPEVHVSEMMNMVKLTFMDQQLEADYQVHRRQHITQYRISYRLNFLFLCVVTIMMVIEEMFCNQQEIGYAEAGIAFAPYLISFCLYVSSHYDWLFINYFDRLLGGFVLAIAFFQLVSDTILSKDGVPSTAIYSVLIFIFFRIPFLHAVVYNIVHFLAFTLRYALTVTLSKNAEEKSSSNRDANDTFFTPGSTSRRYFPQVLEAVSLSKLYTYLPVLLGIEAFTGFAAYRLEYNRRKAFLLDYKVEGTRIRQTEILHTMLPPFVVEHMLNGPFNKNGVPVGLKAEDRGTVSVLFCDVYDFQNLVASVAPTHLVKVLDSLFLCFDKCSERFRCAKIETVFETYLAAAGIRLDGSDRDERRPPSDFAFDALCCALIMIRFSRHVTYQVTEQPNNDPLEQSQHVSNSEGSGDRSNSRSKVEITHRTSRSSDARGKKLKRIIVKIGIHSGRVISGVVGAKKPQYALFGDTVNTASRMKSTGKPDHIHVSAATHSLLESDDCLVWEQKETEVKGKGTMTTYLLIQVLLPSMHPGVPPTQAPPQSSPSVADKPDADDNHDEASCSKERRFKKIVRSPVAAVAAMASKDNDRRHSDAAHMEEGEDDEGHMINTVKVETLWSRWNRQGSREMPHPHKPNGAPVPGSPPHRAFYQPGHPESHLSGHTRADERRGYALDDDGIAAEETIFRACVRRIKRTRKGGGGGGPGGGGGGPHTTREVWMSKSSKRIKSEVHRVSLTFKDKGLEDRYKSHYYSNPSNINNIEQAIIIFLATYVIQTLVFIVIPRYEEFWSFQSEASVTWTVRSVFTICSFFLWLLLHFRDRTELSNVVGIKWVVFLANLTFMLSACAVMLESNWSLDFPEDIKPIWLHVDTLQLFFFITILHHNSGLLVQHVILVDLVVCIVAMTFIITVTQRTAVTMEALFLIPLFIVANVFSVFFKEYVERQSFIVNEDMQELADRGRELLRDMLPKEVLDELQQEKLRLAYKHDRITFIFADICGFTTWAEGVDASEVVTVLQSLFAKFDRDSTRFGVFKVCTIGDAYVAVSEPVVEESIAAGLYDPATGAERVLAMAQCMIRDIRTIREKLNIPSLNMRIGLHFGSCVGGVIGSGRLRYDLWGVDVLTGNLMETNGVPGRVCMSQQLVTFLDEQFPGRFHFVFHKAVEVTSRTVNAYLLVTERHSFDNAASGIPDALRGQSYITTLSRDESDTA
eukprot:Blabericola_migrator_1__1474@NODE_138_length_13121_cov_86_467826_g120_i0_p1_GENE_NODE_138_length_13121_cov_86_467826_g120_i0NODE_138_length_13121_cov_86_467826_g120_i0_p1_ORF_typecomplete_len3179_score561_38Guanylate_cyc/PF00211_20/1e43Guanylate_cyc/PF00211_20/4_8e38E1E2_ATPase/PF00122_20/1e21E1E2_ATPase/PF00122_20/1_8e04Hydrolase/PF00702_26/9Hydrolase/PF00702_26/7_2e17PhoLip_ATPase_C/PF16212_5/1_8e04PhoLip_ATPase_C/PF16212_5/5_1e10PhoLip_ATPase_C/PF16212_5/1_1e04PhoLip_ATPase_C/PF16212_5/3_6e03